jgi:N6-L-threonylcarbamoyladenine synthase/protein kinase Bud32
VTWRDPDPEPAATGRYGDGAETDESGATHQGAEATVEFIDGRVVKRRTPRSYRHPDLDERLRRTRTRLEARLTSEARRAGVPTPVVHDVDPREATIEFAFVGDRDLRGALTEARVRDVARHLAALHDAGIVHGDPTTRNVRVSGAGDATGGDRADDDPTADGTDDRTFLIDFGLGYQSRDEEDHAVDLHVFASSLAGTAENADALRAAAEDAYRGASDRGETVLDRLRAVEGRGRYQ